MQTNAKMRGIQITQIRSNRNKQTKVAQGASLALQMSLGPLPLAIPWITSRGQGIEQTKQVAMQLSPHPNLPHCNPMGRQPQLVVYFLLPSVEQLQVIACSHNPSRLSSDVVSNASVPYQIRHSRSSRSRLESLESPY